MSRRSVKPSQYSFSLSEPISEGYSIISRKEARYLGAGGGGVIEGRGEGKLLNRRRGRGTRNKDRRSENDTVHSQPLPAPVVDAVDHRLRQHHVRQRAHLLRRGGTEGQRQRVSDAAMLSGLGLPRCVAPAPQLHQGEQARFTSLAPSFSRPLSFPPRTWIMCARRMGPSLWIKRQERFSASSRLGSEPNSSRLERLRRLILYPLYVSSFVSSGCDLRGVWLCVCVCVCVWEGRVCVSERECEGRRKAAKGSVAVSLLRSLALAFDLRVCARVGQR